MPKSMHQKLTMLENQFFPTPPEVTREMLDPLVSERGYLDIKWKDGILDPQGGNGALLKHIRDRFDRHGNYRSRFYAIELDYQLREVLKSEGFTVLGSDFLEYEEPREFGLIVSNPPFKQGAKHALKEIEHLASEGQLVCLLNAETLRNPCNSDRKRLLSTLAIPHGISSESPDALEQLEDVGAIKWLGQCFKGAERTTDVEVACIYYKSPKEVKANPWESGRFEASQEQEAEEFGANPLASRNAIKTLVVKYQAATRLILERARLDSELSYYLDEIGEKQHYFSGTRESLYPGLKPQEQISKVKALYWRLIFEKTDIGNRIGSDKKELFAKFATEQKNIEFSERNIIEMLTILLGSYKDLMGDLVASVFDRMIGYHEENRKHAEGWKTNSPAKIKKDKVIVPDGVSSCGIWGFEIRKQDFFTDLDKALCYVSGRDYGTLRESGKTTEQVISDRCFAINNNKGDVVYSDPFQSEFFDIKIFKKGTVHLKFRDGSLAKDFQVAASDGRRWVGEVAK